MSTYQNANSYNPPYVQNYKDPQQFETQRNSRYSHIQRNYLNSNNQNYASNQPIEKQHFRNISQDDLRAIMPKQSRTQQKHRFQGNSTYNQQYPYNPNFNGKPQLFKQQNNLKVGGKFEGESNYAMNYMGQNSRIKNEKITHPQNQIFPKGSFQGNSLSHETFIASQIPKNHQFKPEGQLKIGLAKFQGNSSYLNDFAFKQRYVRPQKIIKKQNQVMPRGDFKGQSTYTSNYVQGNVQKAQQFKPEQQLKVGGKFQGLSSYSNDYISSGNNVRPDRIRPPKNDFMPHGNFQGQSSYQNSYIQSQIKRNPQFRPEGQIKVGGNKFIGQSSYSNDYMSRLQGQRNEYIKPKANQIFPKGYFQGDSTYNQNYIPGVIQKGQIFKPEGEIKIGGTKFQGASSYSGDYFQKGKPIKAERALLPNNKIMPEGKFQGQSSYQNSYIPSMIQKRQKIVGRSELKVGGQKFQGESSYSQSYLGYQYSPIKNNKYSNLGQSTNQNYVPGQASRWNAKQSRWQ